MSWMPNLFGAEANDDKLNTEDPELVGSSSDSETDWRPLPRAETLQGPDLNDFLKKNNQKERRG